MAEVFTISGAEPYELGALPSAQEVQCAKRVKPLLVTGAVMRVGAVPVGLFGTYKLFKAHWAAGITALLGTGVLWFVGGSAMVAAANQFEQCRKP